MLTANIDWKFSPRKWKYSRACLGSMNSKTKMVAEIVRPGSNLTPTAPEARWKVLASKSAPYERKIRLWKLRNLWKLLWSLVNMWFHYSGWIKLFREIWQTWQNAVFQQEFAASCERLLPGSGNSTSLDFLPSSHLGPLTWVDSI